MIERMEEFEAFLKKRDLSENTVKAYFYAVKQYDARYSKITKGYLQKYKLFLLENYKPKTVNLRIRALNCYLEFVGKSKTDLYPGRFTGGSGSVDAGERNRKRIPFFKSFRGSDHYKRNCEPIKTAGYPLRHPDGSGISSFLPAQVCQKFSGTVFRYCPAG